jgi:hypothetical protein
MQNTKLKKPTPRYRLACLAIAMGVIPIGLMSKVLRSDADASTAFGFVITYLGDTLWAVMFFFFFAALLPCWRAWAIGLLTLGGTLGIEFSQLYAGEPLATLRSFAPTRFLLGSHFLWSDVICLAVGTALATGLHSLIVRMRPTRQMPLNY